MLPTSNQGKVVQGRYLTLDPIPTGMKVRLTDAGRSELADLRESHPDWNDVHLFAELFEDFATNGWTLLDPSTIGLTGCQLGISPDVGDDPSDPSEPATIYWHDRYAVELATEVLQNGELYLRNADKT